MSQSSYLDRALFSAITEKAGQSPRGRRHHNFHEMDEPCHRMAVGLQPETYIPPHRHQALDKAETLIVLKGKLGLLIFDDAGQVIDKRVMQTGGECLGVDLPPGTFHGLVVLERDSVMFECKAGPYRPVGDGDMAPWAPKEGEPEVAVYQAWMRAHFD